jgi:hypothetical protein
MHGNSVSDYELQEWFEFKIPRLKFPETISQRIGRSDDSTANRRCLFILGGKASGEYFTKI